MEDLLSQTTLSGLAGADIEDQTVQVLSVLNYDLRRATSPEVYASISDAVADDAFLNSWLAEDLAFVLEPIWLTFWI